MRKIKVLVVDDSELIRQVLTEIINSSADLEVVGTAEDPYDARDKIKQLNPDVLTLDIEMPKMDGISFLRNLMRLRPMPVVMISTLTVKGAPATLDALEIGAVDYIAKPQGGGWMDLKGYAQLIQDKVRMAAKANLSGSDKPAALASGKPKPVVNQLYHPAKIVCLGSSTGGTEALKEVLSGMPKNCPPILMAQHIPETFSTTFANRLNDSSEITVYEAKPGMLIEPGHAYLAPGNLHLTVRAKDDGRLYTALLDGDKVCGHRPSVDVLFKSLAKQVGKNTVAAILTGMGADGAEGLKDIHDVGGFTVAQDEATSVVWGMPGAAVRLNAAEKVMPLTRIRDCLLGACVK